MENKKQVSIKQFEKFVMPRLKKVAALETAFEKHPTIAIAREAEEVSRELRDFYDSTGIQFTADTTDVLTRIAATLSGLLDERDKREGRSTKKVQRRAHKKVGVMAGLLRNLSSKVSARPSRSNPLGKNVKVSRGGRNKSRSVRKRMRSQGVV